MAGNTFACRIFQTLWVIGRTSPRGYLFHGDPFFKKPADQGKKISPDMEHIGSCLYLLSYFHNRSLSPYCKNILFSGYGIQKIPSAYLHRSAVHIHNLQGPPKNNKNTGLSFLFRRIGIPQGNTGIRDLWRLSS